MKTDRDKMIEWIKDAPLSKISKMTWGDASNTHQIERLADYLIAKGVTIHVRCSECLWSRERYGKLECIQGLAYRNTYNDPNMFCCYGERKEE